LFARAYRKALITVGGNATLLRFLAFLWKIIPFRARRGVTFLFIKTVLWEKQMLKTDDQTEITAIKDLGGSQTLLISQFSAHGEAVEPPVSGRSVSSEAT